MSLKKNKMKIIDEINKNDIRELNLKIETITNISLVQYLKKKIKRIIIKKEDNDKNEDEDEKIMKKNLQWMIQ